MRPWLKKTWRTSILLLVVVTALLLSWLGATDSGLRWAYGQASAYIPAELHIARLEGRLFGRITASDISYQQAGVQVSLAQASLRWRPLELFTGSIAISQLRAQSLTITLPPGEQPAQVGNGPALQLPDIRLPWRLRLDDIEISDVTIVQGEQVVALQQIQLSASGLFNSIDIDALRVVAEQFEVAINGTLKLAGRYQHHLQMQWRVRLPSAQ
ncbi:MAG: hypothetical protein R6X06_10155, partial [Gammaproteobacteria bacterium]